MFSLASHLQMLKGSDHFFSVAESGSLGAFGILLAFVLGGALFSILGITVAHLLSPHRPNPEKLTTYECGEDPVGSAGIQFHIRFYLVALVFLIFEVEILFLFPWSTVFAHADWVAADLRWGYLAMGEMLVFALILILGLVYAWQRGDLNAGAPTPVVKADKAVAKTIYQKVNKRYLKA